MWVVPSFVTKVFSVDRLALVARYEIFYHRDRVRCGRHSIGPSNRKPPDGLTCTVLEKVFRPVYYRLKRRSIIIFVGKFSRRKCSCGDDKTFVLLHTGHTIFPVSCLKSVSQRDTAVSSQKRPTSVLDTDDSYHVACLHDIIMFWGQDYRRFSSISRCSTHNLCSEMT